MTRSLKGGQNAQKEIIKFIDNVCLYVAYQCFGNRR